MVRSRYRTTVSRGTSRKFIWARNQVAIAQTGDALGTDLLFQFEQDYGAQLIGCTVTRIRGYVYAYAANADPSSANQFRWGVRVAGPVDLSGPVPDYGPYADENADWMAWYPMATVTDPAENVIGGDTLTAQRVDVKAQRRVEELGERLIAFYAGNPGAPTITWNVGWDLSIGIKLP